MRLTVSARSAWDADGGVTKVLKYRGTKAFARVCVGNHALQFCVLDLFSALHLLRVDLDRRTDPSTARTVDQPSRCGWLKDRFGLSWQIIPNALGRMLSDKDRAKSERVMKVMLQMDKLDLKGLQQAHEGV